MKTIQLNSFKIATKLPLAKIADFFKMHRPLSWKEYVVLEGYHLDMVLKHHSGLKKVYLYQFGCTTFINFDPDEIRLFLEYIESIVGRLDYNLFAKFHEGHTLNVAENGCFSLPIEGENTVLYQEELIPILSNILAKSIALYKIEIDVDHLLDQAEVFILNLQKGRLRANTRRFQSTTAKILRFEFESIRAIRIFDRSIVNRPGMYAIESYDSLADYYELQDRFQIIQSKMEDLQQIMKAYSTLSFSENENRLYWFEIFLLGLFPLSHGVHYILDTYHTLNVFEFLLK